MLHRYATAQDGRTADASARRLGDGADRASAQRATAGAARGSRAGPWRVTQCRDRGEAWRMRFTRKPCSAARTWPGWSSRWQRISRWPRTARIGAPIPIASTAEGVAGLLDVLIRDMPAGPDKRLAIEAIVSQLLTRLAQAREQSKMSGHIRTSALGLMGNALASRWQDPGPRNGSRAAAKRCCCCAPARASARHHGEQTDTLPTRSTRR